MNIRGLNVILLIGCLVVVSTDSVSQDEAVEPKIDFTTTIKPIIDARCATCHNEDDEEGGLDLNDLERLMEYVVAEKPLESALFQCLTASNDLSQMPPEEDNEGNPLEPCTQSEMALIFLWIQQGASFEGVKVEEKEEETRSGIQRLFLFSGYFHPAIVHFPIALITMSAFFIIVFFRNETLSDDAAFFLLLFGTLAAIAASVLGWAFADKNPVAVTDFTIGINRHRWFGIGATALALISTILGWRARSDMNGKSGGAWKFGVILTAALMGLVGHQGGEEVYGEGMYERAAEKLIPEYWPFGKDDEKQGDENQPAEKEKDDSDDQGNSGDSQNQPEDDNSSNDADPDDKGSPTDDGNSDDKKGGPPVDPTINKG